MQGTLFPFPLPARSGHHSNYHRFLLGADPRTLDPLPGPRIAGSLEGPVRSLAGAASLRAWRRLYAGSFPWVSGFAREHYEPGCVPAHRPLPVEYGRPARRHAAYDFVQIADPALSALALVAGDRRLIDGFSLLSDRFLKNVEAGAGSRDTGPGRGNPAGRLLAGQFVEPNNRWLMPMLHTHTRVLNFTQSAPSPLELHCVDSGALARSGRRALQAHRGDQADFLRSLGYGVRNGDRQDLIVAAVDPILLAAIRAPRMAVLEILERLVGGERRASKGILESELPDAVIATLCEQLERAVARSVSRFKPDKVDIPSRGPWRRAVRAHLGRLCPASLAKLDAEARRARALPIGEVPVPCPMLDAAHAHASCSGDWEGPVQEPTDPELAEAAQLAAPAEPQPWLAEAFERGLNSVCARIASGALQPDRDPNSRLASRLESVQDGLTELQSEQASLFLAAELERASPFPRPARARRQLVPVEELVAASLTRPAVLEREGVGLAR